MTAAFQTRTTLGQLVYRALPPLDFGRLAADLEAALGGSEARGLGAALERDGVALMDRGGARVGLALARGLDGRGAAAVIVSVGFGPEDGGEASLARRQAVLARLIVQRIAARFPPLETVWAESDEVASPALFVGLREGLVERRRLQDAERARRARSRQEADGLALSAPDVQRMFARLEVALDARRMARPELALAGAPGRGPAADAAASGTTSPLLRLAAHLMDATLMLIALPVGVAMMIYSLARGGDVNTSARVLAVSGTAMGVAQLVGGGALLQAFML